MCLLESIDQLIAILVMILHYILATANITT